MKLILCLTLCAFVPSLFAQADNPKFQAALARLRAQRTGVVLTQTAARISDLSLDVKETGGRHAVDVGLNYGPHDVEKTVTRAKLLNAELRNLSHAPATGAVLEIFWVAWDHDKREFFIAQKDDKAADIAPATSISLDSSSPDFSTHTQDFSLIGHYSADGLDLEGYIVRCRIGDQLGAFKCSTSLQPIATDGRLPPMIAVYEKWKAAQKSAAAR